MADLWGVLGALAAVAVPMALAGWLLGRAEHRRGPGKEVRGKMPPKEHD